MRMSSKKAPPLLIAAKSMPSGRMATATGGASRVVLKYRQVIECRSNAYTDHAVPASPRLAIARSCVPVCTMAE